MNASKDICTKMSTVVFIFIKIDATEKKGFISRNLKEMLMHLLNGIKIMLPQITLLKRL